MESENLKIIPSTMKARRVGMPIRAETLFSQMHSRMMIPMRMRKRVIISCL